MVAPSHPWLLLAGLLGLVSLLGPVEGEPLLGDGVQLLQAEPLRVERQQPAGQKNQTAARHERIWRDPDFAPGEDLPRKPKPVKGRKPVKPVNDTKIAQHVWAQVPYASDKVVGRSFTEERRLLVFFAVGANRRAMAMVKSNILHLRSFENASENISFDVYFAHYDKKSFVWMQEDPAFYQKHVQFHKDRNGLKFMLAKDLLLHPDEEGPAVNVSDYQWIWFLDEDADITKMDMRYLVKDLYDTGSLIVTPSIMVVDPNVMSPAASLDARPGAVSLLRQAGASRCQIGQAECALQLPHSQCMFRHTNYIEVSFPLIRSDIFKAVFKSCKFCMHKRSVWGLDRVWCSYAASVSGIQGFNTSASCAVLDRATLVHRNFKTLAKWNHGVGARQLDIFDMEEVKANMPEHWVENVTMNGCHL